jgi:predicted transcriptional regulator
MKLHYGQVVERQVRRNGYSITSLAKLTQVNRRSIYNWFNQENLNISIINRVGWAINHDFAADLPELYRLDKFKVSENTLETISIRNESDIKKIQAEENWKNKYIVLLEKYNELLKSEGEEV